MKTAIVFCAILALTGNFTKLFITKSKSSAVFYIINTFIGVLIIFSIFHAVTKENFHSFEFDFRSTNNYESIEKGTMKKIIENAETETENLIATKIKDKFKIKNVTCDVKINESNLDVEKAVLYLDISEKILSGYEIQNYVRNEFEIEIEVYLT